MNTKSLTKRSFAILATTLLLLVALPVIAALAADTGFFFANATIADNSVQNQDDGWTSDDQYATFNSTSDTADYGFPALGIPVGATIDGIEVSIEGQRSGTGASRDLTAALWNTSALEPDAFTASKTAVMANDDTLVTLGSPTDTWGTTWTVADFADATFLIRVGATSGNANVDLDAVSVKVYYTTGTPTTTTLSPLNPVTYGTPVTFTATVSPTPTDGVNVEFYDGLTLLGTGTTLSGVASYTTTETQLSAIDSPHSITAKFVGDASFVASTSAAESQVVNAKEVTVTANNKAKNVGDPDPVFDFVASGFVGSDTFVTEPTCEAADPHTDPGTYAITCSGGDAGGNYTITYVPGTLTVNAVNPVATFADVPTDYWAWQYIEAIYAAGITGGCGTNPLIYCPTSAVTRDQMAVFLLRGIHGGSYTPPPATGTIFNDVPADYWAAAWIEQLFAEGITGGCGNNNYCPTSPVTRDQMAVFLLRAKHGSGHVPPAATGTVFNDVAANYWAAAWIEQLAAEGITGGCGNNNYCPLTAVTRDQMAVFLQRTFNLPLP